MRTSCHGRAVTSCSAIARAQIHQRRRSTLTAKRARAALVRRQRLRRSSRSIFQPCSGQVTARRGRCPATAGRPCAGSWSSARRPGRRRCGTRRCRRAAVLHHAGARRRDVVERGRCRSSCRHVASCPSAALHADRGKRTSNSRRRRGFGDALAPRDRLAHLLQRRRAGARTAPAAAPRRRALRLDVVEADALDPVARCARGSALPRGRAGGRRRQYSSTSSSVFDLAQELRDLGLDAAVAADIELLAGIDADRRRRP